MKIKKILSGIVAGALALSTMASMSLFSTSAAEEVVWEGEAVASWSKEVVLEGASNIITAEEGGILGFEGTVTGTNPQIQFVTKQGSGWTWTPFTDAEGNEYFDINATTGKLSIKLSAEQASQLTTSKEFDVKGQGYTLTKLTYTAPGGTSGGSTSEPETVWEGEAAASWSKEVVLDGASNIITAVEGGILGFEGTVTGTNPQIQFVTKQGSGWTWTPFTDAEGNEYFDINATTGKLSIKLSAEQASQLTTSKEFDIKGQNYTLTKLTYTAPASSDSSSTVESSTVDTSSEVESSTVDPTSEALKTWISDASTKKSAWYSKCASDKYVMVPADLAFDPSLVDGLKFTIRYDGDNANGSFGVSTVGEGWGQVEWSLDTTDDLPEECTQVSANVYSFEFTNIVADWFEGNAIDPEASEASWAVNGFNRLGEANDWVETTFELLSIDLLDGDGNVVYSAGGTSDSSSEVESSLPDSSSEVESSLPDSSSEAESSLPDSS
ncbi:MAG: hypothetical protein ACI4I7_05375, partial [Oscillospiraceae bacterium]